MHLVYERHSLRVSQRRVASAWKIFLFAAVTAFAQDSRRASKGFGEMTNEKILFGTVILSFRYRGENFLGVSV